METQHLFPNCGFSDYETCVFDKHHDISLFVYQHAGLEAVVSDRCQPNAAFFSTLKGCHDIVLI